MMTKWWMRVAALCLAGILMGSWVPVRAQGAEGYGYFSCLVVDSTSHTLVLGKIAPFIYAVPVLPAGDDPAVLSGNLLSEAAAFSASLAVEAEQFATLVVRQLGRPCSDPATDSVVSGPYRDVPDAEMAQEEYKLMSRWTAKAMAKTYGIQIIDFPVE